MQETLSQPVKLAGIKAEHLTTWSRKTNPKCKFLPNDSVRFGRIPTREWNAQRDNMISKKCYNYQGQIGTIVGVSCAWNYNTQKFTMRGTHSGIQRMYTRYFVQFEDGYVCGIHSQLLTKV